MGPLVCLAQIPANVVWFQAAVLGQARSLLILLTPFPKKESNSCRTGALSTNSITIIGSLLIPGCRREPVAETLVLGTKSFCLLINNVETNLEYAALSNASYNGLNRNSFSANKLETEMLRLGEFNSRSCDGVSRRAFVQAGATLPLTAMLSGEQIAQAATCLLYTSPSPRDRTRSRMPSSA